jgi:hypothetical protein
MEDGLRRKRAQNKAGRWTDKAVRAAYFDLGPLLALALPSEFLTTNNIP